VKEILSVLAYLHGINIFVGVIWAVCVVLIVLLHTRKDGETDHVLSIQRSIMIDDEGHARLSDVGIQFMLNNARKTGQVTSGARWQAPEIVIPQDDTPATATAASDMYSAAMTIYEVTPTTVVQYHQRTHDRYCRCTRRGPFTMVVRTSSLFVSSNKGS
jgi:serine/threonine protein kinase